MVGGIEYEPLITLLKEILMTGLSYVIGDACLFFWQDPRVFSRLLMAGSCHLKKKLAACDSLHFEDKSAEFALPGVRSFVDPFFWPRRRKPTTK